jgi:hypothetical protein
MTKHRPIQLLHSTWLPNHHHPHPPPSPPQRAWAESRPRVPLICLLSPGSDPTKLIEDLAKRKKIKTLGVSMGQGQEVGGGEALTFGLDLLTQSLPSFAVCINWCCQKPCSRGSTTHQSAAPKYIFNRAPPTHQPTQPKQKVIARKYVATAVAEGQWVLLQNTHLGLGYLAEVEAALVKVRGADLEDSLVGLLAPRPCGRGCNNLNINLNLNLNLKTEELHEDFRLWITAEPHPQFPIGLLQVGGWSVLG